MRLRPRQDRILEQDVGHSITVETGPMELPCSSTTTDDCDGSAEMAEGTQADRRSLTSELSVSSGSTQLSPPPQPPAAPAHPPPLHRPPRPSCSNLSLLSILVDVH